MVKMENEKGLIQKQQHASNARNHFFSFKDPFFHECLAFSHFSSNVCLHGIFFSKCLQCSGVFLLYLTSFKQILGLCYFCPVHNTQYTIQNTYSPILTQLHIQHSLQKHSIIFNPKIAARLKLESFTEFAVANLME